MMSSQALRRYRKVLKEHDRARVALLAASEKLAAKTSGMTIKQADKLYEADPGYSAAREAFHTTLAKASIAHRLAQIAGCFGPLFPSEEDDDE